MLYCIIKIIILLLSIDMKKQYQPDLNQELLKQNIIANSQQNYYPSARRTNKTNHESTQHNNSFTHPLNSHQYRRKGTETNQQNSQNPQKIKSSSFYQKSKPSNKLDYLLFAQRHYKEQKKFQEQKEKTIDIKQLKQLSELKQKMQSYFADLQKKDETIIKNQRQINDKDKIIKQANEKIKALENDCLRYQTDYNSLSQQFKHHQQYYSAIAENHNFLSEKCGQLQTILQQKDTYIQKIIQSKDQQYQSAVRSKNNQIQALEQRLNILETANSQLVSKINQLQSEQRIFYNKSSQNQPQDLSALGEQFESRINYYVDENSRLKNIISHYEGQVEHLRTQKDSLQSTVRAYEQRDKDQRESSKLYEQLIYLRNALQNQKEQKDRAISKYQLQILKLQNLMSSKRLETHTNLIDMFDEQRLHQSLYVALEQIQRLKIRLLQTKAK